MTPAHETAAVVALLRTAAKPWAALIEQRGSAIAVLDEEQGLLAGHSLADAAAEVAGWKRRGMRLLTVLDPDYPENLRMVHDRPPLIFVAGELEPRDARLVAVVGARAATTAGLVRTRAFAEELVQAGYAIASGLAAGIDTEAHTAALRCGGRTLAVIGTGLGRCYPPENASLQRRIAAQGAVVSQFWPDSGPSKRSFPMRNATMSGLSLGTVVVEALAHSGARIQARLALAHGRPVFLSQALLEEPWARECAAKPGTHVVRRAEDVVTVIERCNAPGALVS